MAEPVKTRIGILGGTFNPIHLGHLILGQSAIETHDLLKVLFVPCSTPPHKDTAGLLPGEHRAAMVRAGTEGNPAFEFCDVEMKRGGVSYAVDTVGELREQYPRAELYFIIGADTLLELHLWRQVYSLLPLCQFVTFARPGTNDHAITAASLKLRAPWPERLLANVSSSRLIDISSSDIRHRVAEGMSIRYLVPTAVELYIAEHHLYAG